MLKNIRNPKNMRKLEQLNKDFGHLTWTKEQEEYLSSLLEIINDELTYGFSEGVKKGMDITDRYKAGCPIQKGDIKTGLKLLENITTPNNSRGY